MVGSDLAKNLRFTMCILLLFINLGSCLTQVPKPESINSTLLIISTESKIAPDGRFCKAYLMMKIKGVKETITIRPQARYIVVSGLPPGDYVTEQVQEKISVFGSWETDAVGLNPPEPIRVPFKLTARSITVFPVKFVFIVEGSGNRFSSRWQLIQLSIDDKKNILSKLAHQDAFFLWNNEFNID